MCKVENPNSRSGDRFFAHHDWQLAVVNGVERQRCTRCAKLNPVGQPPWIRFWDHVKQGEPGECWPWIGRVSHQGYGYFTIMFGSSKKVMSAHRYAYFLSHGEFPVGTTDIDHLCKNRGCNNPLHLEATTHQINVQRAKAITHCKWGHEFKEPNFYHYKSKGKPKKRCLACWKAEQVKAKERRLAAMAVQPQTR